MQAYFVEVKVRSNGKVLRSDLYWTPLLGNTEDLGSVVVFEAMKEGTIVDDELLEGWDHSEITLGVIQLPQSYEALQAIKSAERGLASAKAFLERLTK